MQITHIFLEGESPTLKAHRLIEVFKILFELFQGEGPPLDEAFYRTFKFWYDEHLWTPFISKETYISSKWLGQLIVKKKLYTLHIENIRIPVHKSEANLFFRNLVEHWGTPALTWVQKMFSQFRTARCSLWISKVNIKLLFFWTPHHCKISFCL